MEELTNVQTVYDLQERLGNGYELYLGFDKLDPKLNLKEIQTDSKRKINIIDNSRLDKLEKEGKVNTNYVYYTKISDVIHNGLKTDCLEVYGVTSSDFTDPLVDEEDFDEHTPIKIHCEEIFLNRRYPDYTNFFTFKGVRIHSNKYNTANGILGKISGPFQVNRYVFIADSIIIFNFPEEIDEFYSFEIEFFPDFFAKSENYIYFINRDILMKYSSPFNPIEFEAKFFAKNYKSDGKVSRRAEIANALNLFRLEGILSGSEDFAGLLEIDTRILEKENLQEKIEVFQTATVDEEAEFDYDEHFEIYYY